MQIMHSYMTSNCDDIDLIHIHDLNNILVESWYLYMAQEKAKMQSERHAVV